MRRKWLFAALSAAVVLSLAGYFCLTHQTSGVFVTVHHVGPLTWYDGPDVEMSPETAKTINGELAGIIAAEAPGQGISCTVASHGKRRVDVNYSLQIPVALQDKLNTYIEHRAFELIFEQADAKPSK
jgi:hypothetical protein